MKLPHDAIGPTDILQYRDCPSRFAFGMRRHAGDEPPESTTWANAYGSCIHDAIQVVEEEGLTDMEAVDRVWPTYQHWLEVEDVDRLVQDLETYRSRQVTGYRLIGTELELKIPLYTQEDGTVIHLRGRIDVLYQRIDNPGMFLMRDYKSSRWPKTEQEVHTDVQQWAYNLLVHEVYPECRTLVQIYDQLRYGEIPTRKSDQQREQIKTWLIRQVKAIVADEELAPKQNQFCPHCPLMFDCKVTHASTEFWRRKLAVVAPEEKVGRKVFVKLQSDDVEFQHYVDILPRAQVTMKTLERFVEAVKDALKQMPSERRDQFGYRLQERAGSRFSAEALQRIAEIMGPEFFHAAKLSKAALEDFYGKAGSEAADATPLNEIMALAEKTTGAIMVMPKRQS